MNMAKYGGQRSQHPANVNFEPGLKSEISAIKGGSRGGEGFRRLMANAIKKFHIFFTSQLLWPQLCSLKVFLREMTNGQNQMQSMDMNCCHTK